MKRISVFFMFIVAMGVGAALMYFFFNKEHLEYASNENGEIIYAKPHQNSEKQRIAAPAVDMRQAAANSVKSVVHVKTQYTERTRYQNPFLEFFYGNVRKAPTRKVQSSGSGVILSSDGYIITNNHVIQRSDQIKVVLNDQREFVARLVGTDKNTDLALLKIEATELDSIKFADSDQLALGEWVLAVGNPYNLTSTVTAGIVSAKARAIGSPRVRRMSLDAFIQTDAAVNPGNSGGALVNISGELVGINTAIQSTTGSYVGYSFAIPSNIVAKVAEDLKDFGRVRRGYLGVQIATVTSEIARQLNLQEVGGVVILRVNKGGAAQLAGILPEDVITEVNSMKIRTVEQLQEQLGKYSPDDEIIISIKRQGRVKHFTLKLRNSFEGR